MTEQGQEQSTVKTTETPEQEERAFTQADMNKTGAREKREGRQSEQTRLLEKYGVESEEDLDQIVTTFREAQDEAQTDLDRYEQENKALKEREKAALKLADDRLIGAELRTALMGAGVPADRLNDALALTDRATLAVEKDGTVTGLEDAVKATLEPRSWLTEGAEPQAPRRAADVSRQPATTSNDPQQQHANFLASLLGHNST